MSWEVPTFIVAGLALVATVVYGEIQRRAQRRDRQIAQEQLRLAREQAEMRPVLEVAEVRLLDVSDVEELEEYVRPIREFRAERSEKERREREREGKEKQQKQERSKGLDISKLDSKELEAESGEGASWPGILSGLTPQVQFPDLIHRSSASEPYEGPLPDKVVRIKLVNQGRTAAYEVTGWIYFDHAHLEPVDEFGDGYDVEVLKDGWCKVAVGGGTGCSLLPTVNDPLSFDIAVKVHSLGKTQIEYEFTTPQGDNKAGLSDLYV